MRNVCFAITLEYIKNTFDIKQIDSSNYWPIKDFICVNTHNLLRAQSLKFCVFELRTTYFDLAVQSNLY